LFNWLWARKTGGTIGQALRVALTGRIASPSLFHVMHVVGREHSLARLARV
jgi:glutamyl-tRNA synthetase